MSIAHRAVDSPIGRKKLEISELSSIFTETD